MWFGDLVTMSWWNGIWLNEAFATYMALCCLDDFKPEYQCWVGLQPRPGDGALPRRAAHDAADRVPRATPPTRSTRCSTPSPTKRAAAFLRMLEQYLGTERFRDGVRRYLAAHRYAQHRDDRPVGRDRGGRRGTADPRAHGLVDLPGRAPARHRQRGRPRRPAHSRALLLPAGRGQARGLRPSAIGSSWLVPVAMQSAASHRCRSAARRTTTSCCANNPFASRPAKACSWSTPAVAASTACATRTSSSTTSSPASTGSSRSSASGSSPTPGLARWPARRPSSSSSPWCGTSRARKTRVYGRWSPARSGSWTSPSPSQTARAGGLHPVAARTRARTRRLGPP